MSYLELFYGDQPGWIDNSSRISTRYPAVVTRPVGWQKTSLIFHVNLCCESCVEKIRKSLAKDEGVEAVDVDMQKSKVIVTGFLTPERVLRRIRKVKKSATFWNSSYDDGSHNPYSHTADYDYTDPHAFDRSTAHSSYYDYDHSFSRPYDYSSRNRNFEYSRDSPNSYYNHGGNHRRSSYDTYRHL